eukprot:GAHX01001899.1.p1 GENE.GAHX01001899.1~~GAHX01001899.1.p1  ORF type:complete len:343 (+),score=91.02 GAHX01001899.1:1234-2262(+)
MDKIETEEQLTAFQLLEDSKLATSDDIILDTDLTYSKQTKIPLDVFSDNTIIGEFKNPTDETLYKTIIATEEPFDSFMAEIETCGSALPVSFCDPSECDVGRLVPPEDNINKKIENINELLKKTNAKKRSGKLTEDGKLVVKAYLRDPNLPKRPATPYLRFAVDERRKIMADDPATSFKDSAQIAAKRWKEMGEEEKDEYKQGYIEDKFKYDKATERYKNSKVRKDFVMLRGAIKSDQYNMIEPVVKKKRWMSKKNVNINLNYDPGMDNDVDFWTVYHEISSFTDKNVLGDLIRVFNKYKVGATEEQKEMYNKEVEKIQELGDYFKSFVIFVKKNVLNNKDK